MFTNYADTKRGEPVRLVFLVLKHEHTTLLLPVLYMYFILEEREYISERHSNLGDNYRQARSWKK